MSRYATGWTEVDRVLGGGIVPGSVILWSGEPGIGKSTMLAQIVNSVKLPEGGSLVYVSGEESAAQVRDRLERLSCDFAKFKFAGETNAEKIISLLIETKPKVAVIDSIQTVYSAEVPAEPGGVSQIRACALKLLQAAKENDIAIVLVGHITKDGGVAGPKSLEHIVDTVVYLETESAGNYRVLRATKNRFGSINEIGLFEMTGQGFKEIKNPSLVFIDGHTDPITGSVISSIMEGTRPFLVEIQSLVTKTVFGYPQRKASGFDLNRLQVLSAVLTKRGGVNLSNQDVILNVVGGFKVTDPALDLAVCLAIASSLLNQTISRKTLVLGEVGLGGEVRNVSRLNDRLKEAEKLGFDTAIVPDAGTEKSQMRIVKIKNLKQMLDVIKQA